MKLFSEIKRRQVIQGVIAYTVAGWLLIQLAIALEASLELPPYVDRWTTIAVIAGFPIAIILAWVFEISLDGIRLTKDTDVCDTLETAASEDAEKRPPPKHSIAVLPFSDMSPEGDQEYLGDGVAEEILNALVKVTELRVTGRTSSFSFKGKDDDIQSIGETLNVAHVLEGSVRSQGDRVRITAQLIQVSDGFHMWSETYDGDLKDVFDLQDTIAKQIISELELLLDADAARLASNLTNSPEAYDEFLRGRDQYHKIVGDDTLSRAVTHFEKAVELDPHFDQAWAYLALAHLNLPEFVETDDPSANYIAAQVAIERTEQINPGSPMALRATALYRCTKRDFFGAIQAYEQAYLTEPENPFMCFGFGYAMGAVGLHERALELLEKAERLDPSYPFNPQNLGMTHFGLGQYEKAVFYLKKSNKLGNVPARWTLATLESERGNIREAYAWMRNYMKDAPPWFRVRLKSPIARFVYYSASIKKAKFATLIARQATLARIRKPSYKPRSYDIMALLFFCPPEYLLNFFAKVQSLMGFPIWVIFFCPQERAGLFCDIRIFHSSQTISAL